jgi:hypothetical protein
MDKQQMEKFTRIPHQDKLVRFSLTYFLEKQLSQDEILEKIDWIAVIAGVPSLNHALGCLDEDVYNSHIVGPIQTRIQARNQQLHVLQQAKGVSEQNLAKWRRVMDHLGRPDPIFQEGKKRLSASAEPCESSKKTRSDSGAALPSSPENQMYGTSTRPSYKKPMYNVAEAMEKLIPESG